MKFGFTPQEYVEFDKHLIQPIRATGAQAWCFGSRARGDHQPFSDVDVMVESKNGLSAVVAAIREYFQESNFPYKVDIVLLEDFAESYRESFDRDKVKLF